MRLPLLAAAALLLSPITAAAAPLKQRPAETITYESGACFGTCAIYSVTVDTRTGAGEFVGKKFTTVTGARRFRATPAQVARFRQDLEFARAVPPGAFKQGGARCKMYATDMNSVRLTWSGNAGAGVAPRSLSIYFGCDMDANRPLFLSVQRAWQALPIMPFIGERRNFPR